MYFGPERKNVRLKNYDYSQDGYYFVTICTKDRMNHFGEIIDGIMNLNEFGNIAKNEILNSGNIRKEIKIDEFIVMPNHLHLIIIINTSRRERLHRSENGSENGSSGITSGTMQSFPTENYCENYFGIDGAIGLNGNNLSSIIRGLKGSINRQINEKQKDFIFSWQKSFYDVIIKDEQQLENVRKYIRENPSRWQPKISP